MKTDIKRVNWQMGQMLLPHHLFAQEESLLGHSAQALKHSGLPNYGIVKANWDEDLFYQGIISISELTLMLPSGQLVDIPGNTLSATFDLNSTGKSEVILFLHVLDEKQEKEEEVRLKDETVKIKFALDHSLLSPQKNADLSRHVFKLAHFEKSQESVWRLNETYIPPLLTTHPKPYLSNTFTDTLRVIKNVTKKIEREMENAEFFAAHSSEWRLCLVELARLNRFCENCLKESVTPHPYYFYDKMCNVLDCTRSANDETPSYDHENLAFLFNTLLQKLEFMFIDDNKEFTFIEFERKDSSYFIETLPPTLAKAKEVYLIVQKPSVESQFSGNSLKLTSRQRKEFIEHFFVSGISLNPISKPAFLNSRFAEEVEAFSIEQREEWKKALSEGNLVLSHQDLSKEYHVFLYWRSPDGAF